MIGDLIVLALSVYGAKYIYERSTGKLTEERSTFYRERVFGISLRFVIGIAAVLAVIIGGFILLVMFTPTVRGGILNVGRVGKDGVGWFCCG